MSAQGSISSVSSSLNGKVIVLDSGHGGIDGRAAGLYGTIEKSLTLQTARRLSDVLTVSGGKDVLTRTGNQYVPLPA